MTAESTTDPIRISLEVRCPAAHAFKVWVEKTALWWPDASATSGEKDIEVVFEQRLGGRVFERTRTGAEFDWGEINVWEPPRRLGYLWWIMTDRENATEVEITFNDRGSTTQVEIEHRGWERLGTFGLEWRQANHAGWDGVLPLFVEACQSDDPRLRDA